MKDVFAVVIVIALMVYLLWRAIDGVVVAGILFGALVGLFAGYWLGKPEEVRE